MLCLQNCLFDTAKAVKSIESVIATFPYVLKMSRKLNPLDTSGKYHNKNLPGERPINND